MLDTVKLCVPVSECKINSPDCFSPSIRQGIRLKTKYIFNDRNYWSKQGLYFPKLTIFKNHNLQDCLYIEFSAPKLLYGNNFDELSNDNFLHVVDNLIDRLSGMDIEISKEVIEQAEIFAIHYSKNFELVNAQSGCLINTISKLDIPKRLDISKTDYKNGGQIVRFHTNSYEIAFYDKVADLKQSLISEKRAFENDNFIQQELFEKLSMREVLRMEVRLNKRKKIKHVFEKCNIKNDSLIFKNLFNSNISKTILNYFWAKFVEKSIYIVCQSNANNSVILSKCAIAGYSQQKTLRIAGIMATIKDNGCRYTKEKIKNAGFNKYVKDIELLNLEDNYLLKQFRDVKVKLQRMTPLRI